MPMLQPEKVSTGHLVFKLGIFSRSVRTESTSAELWILPLLHIQEALGINSERISYAGHMIHDVPLSLVVDATLVP